VSVFVNFVMHPPYVCVTMPGSDAIEEKRGGPDSSGKWKLDYGAYKGVGLRVHPFILEAPTTEQTEAGHEFLIQNIPSYEKNGRTSNAGAKIVVTCNLGESETFCLLREARPENTTTMKVARAWERKFRTHFATELEATPDAPAARFTQTDACEDDDPVITFVLLIDQWWAFKKLAQFELCAHRSEIHDIHTMRVPEDRIPRIGEVLVHPLPLDCLVQVGRVV
jgi:hypothetical protein